MTTLKSYFIPFVLGLVATYAVMTFKWGGVPDVASVAMTFGFFCIVFAIPEIIKDHWENEYSYNLLTPLLFGAIVLLVSFYVSCYFIFNAQIYKNIALHEKLMMTLISSQSLIANEFFGIFMGAIFGGLFSLLIPFFNGDNIYLYRKVVFPVAISRQEEGGSNNNTRKKKKRHR